MTFSKLTASTAAFLLSSTALMAQEAQSQSYQSVFLDVGGTAVLVPVDVAAEACGLDAATLQTAFQSRLDESGADQTQFMAQMDSAMGMMGQGGTGDAASQDTAAAGTGDASGTMTTEGTTSADAGTTTGAAATTDTATANAGAASGTDSAATSGDTTQMADGNATTNAGNTTTDAGNTTTTADAGGAASGDASGAAAGTGTTDTATADASGAANQDATAAGTGTGDVQNVESTAADTSGASGAAGSANADPFLVLAACQIDATRATELQIDSAQTGSSLGFDAATLGIQSGTASQ